MRIPILIGLAAALTAARPAPRQEDIPTIARAARGAVVSIVMFDKDSHPIAQGSGFLVSSDGRIVTNYHVIEHGSSAVIKLPDGAFFLVDGVVAVDRVHDIAIIKAHGQDFRTVPVGNSDRLRVGEEVVAIGNPLSLESTVSNGVISAIRAMGSQGGKLLQTTAPISHGSSGGPLFNMEGEIVGITTSAIKGGENLNFAIPTNDARRLLAAPLKLQGLPNEPQDDRAAAPPDDITPLRNPTARDYYEQLYNAGGFRKSISLTSGETLTASLDNYVCFDDDPGVTDFFTFLAIGYDQSYAEALARSTQIAVQKNWKKDPEKVKEFTESTNTLHEIQRTAPYVAFIPKEIMDGLASQSSEAGELFRHGGRMLLMDVYSRGVKYQTLGYVWGDDSWTAPSGGVGRKLSIEPTALRYAEIDASRESLVPVVSHGACEKIPDKQ